MVTCHNPRILFLFVYHIRQALVEAPSTTFARENHLPSQFDFYHFSMIRYILCLGLAFPVVLAECLLCRARPKKREWAFPLQLPLTLPLGHNRPTRASFFAYLSVQGVICRGTV